MADEVTISGIEWRFRDAVPGFAARDCVQQGDGDLGGVDKPRSRAHAGRYIAEFIDIEVGAVSERQEFTSLANRVQIIAEALFGPASTGEAISGGL
jgi:hypothetical protein